MPELSGASGGRCWLGRVRGTVNQPWEAGNIKAHRHTHGKLFCGRARGATSCFTREILVFEHIELIYQEYEDLRQNIIELWPELAGDCVTATT